MSTTISHTNVHSSNKNLIDQVRVKRENAKNSEANATIDDDDK